MAQYQAFYPLGTMQRVAIDLVPIRLVVATTWFDSARSIGAMGAAPQPNRPRYSGSPEAESFDDCSPEYLINLVTE